MTSENLPPRPFDQENPQFGKLVAFFLDKLAVKPKRGPQPVKPLPSNTITYYPPHYVKPKPAPDHHPIYLIDRWSNEAGFGRNEKCLCGSGKKFKQCCINT